jgi:hypothetical protein
MRLQEEGWVGELISEYRGASSCHICLTFLTFKGSQRQTARLPRLLSESQGSNAAEGNRELLLVELA